MGKGDIQSPDDDEPGLWSLHWWRALPDRERAMALTLRFTADYRDRLDYTIVEDGRRNVGRLYEDRHSRPELRWFWSITVYINPNLGITTSGRAPTMNEAESTSYAIGRSAAPSPPAPYPSTAFAYPSAGQKAR